MKKIALIMDGWKRFFTYAWPAGVLERIRETNEDVNLYIFNSSGDWSRDEDYNIGEYNIYRLPDLNDFDGIIVDLNNIRYSKVREYVISSAKATGKPVISIANEIADFYYVGIDNYSAMQEIAAHGKYDADFCLFMENWITKKNMLQTGKLSKEKFDSWKSDMLAYYKNSRLDNEADSKTE